MPVAIPIAAAAVSSAIGASATRQAASQQADAAQRATEAQQAAAAQLRSDLAPWRSTGETANNRIAALLGLNGQTADYTTDPSYQFRLAEGQKAVDNSAAARGSALSGGALKALQKYGQGMASTEFQNTFNRLSTVSGQGQNAAAQQGAATINAGNSTASNLIGAGNAAAAGTVGTANALTSGIGQGIQGYQQNELMKLIAGNKFGSSSAIPMQPGGGY